MRRAAATFLFVATTILPALGATPALACSCIPSTPVDDARRASAVFVGVARGAVEIGRPDVLLTSFDVEAVYKGDLSAGTEVRILHQTLGPSCGLRFQAGERFTVFAYASEDQLEANSCWSTTRGRIPATVLGLDRPSEVIHAPEPSGSGTPWILGAVLVVVGVGAWAIARRARHRTPVEPRV